MSLEPKDLELIEGLIYKNSDDVAVVLSRSFERLEERLDAAESRMYSRLSEIDDHQETLRADLSDTIGDLREEVREFWRVREMSDFVTART